MKKLSVIMPFLNEGCEPINTVISINNTTNPDEIEIIAICDAPTYEYEEEITQFPNVRFIKNQHTIGVDACRSVGVHLAQSNVVLIIDAHMRFSHDEWVSKISAAVNESPKTLWCTRCLVLTDQMTKEELDPLKDVTHKDRRYSVGAKLYYTETDSTPFHLKWMHDSSFMKENDGFVSCVLGANYAGNAEWLRQIRSFEGLISWGFSEQYISIKNWLLGGNCRGLDSVSIGHIFRKQAPFYTPYKNSVHNMLFAAHTLFSDEPDIFDNYMSQLQTQPQFNESMRMIESRWDIVSTYRNYFLTHKTQKLSEFFERFNIQYRSIVYGTNS